MAGTYRFNIDQGATVRRTLRWLREDGVPVDLTGASARMEIRTAIGGELLHRLDTSNGGLTLGGEDGTILMHVPADVTASWTWRSAVYDLELVEEDGTVTRLIQGSVSISPEVTTGE